MKTLLHALEVAAERYEEQRHAAALSYYHVEQRQRFGSKSVLEAHAKMEAAFETQLGELMNLAANLEKAYQRRLEEEEDS
jgi:hypothetical protein